MLALRTTLLLVFTLAPAALAASKTPTCFWSNGTAADSKHLQACKTSLGGDGQYACCPPTGADDLYPFDYPLCTANGLCKAGNSAFLARGGCTDASWGSPSCPQYCPDRAGTGAGKDTAMAGLTNCDASTPYFCCNADHDSGACDCAPPAGNAFRLDGTSPRFLSASPDQASSSSSSSAASPSDVSVASSSDAAAVSSSASASSSSSGGGSGTRTSGSAPAGAVTITATPVVVLAPPAGGSSSSSNAAKPTQASNPAALNAAGGSFGLAAVAAGFLLF